MSEELEKGLKFAEASLAMEPTGFKTSTDGRRAYLAPKILSREPLEAMANVCSPPFGKATLAMCIGPIMS